MHLNRSSSVLLPCRRYSNYFSPGKRRKCHRLTMTEIPDISIGNCEVAKKYAIINNTPLSGDGKVHHEKPDGLQIILKDHPAMTFRNKGHVDIEVCYKSLPKGKQTLDKIVVNKKDDCPSSTTLGRTSKKHRNKAVGIAQRLLLFYIMHEPLTSDLFALEWTKLGKTSTRWQILFNSKGAWKFVYEVLGILRKVLRPSKTFNAVLFSSRDGPIKRC